MQNAQSRSHLAALDKEGNLTSWSPFTTDDVYSLAVSNDHVYIGGNLGSLNGVPTGSLVAVSKGQRGDIVANAAPTISGYVMHLALTDTKLYMGGFFQLTAGGNGVSVAAVELSSGKLLDWKPTINGIAVFSLAATNQHVYVGGQFQSIDGTPRLNVASFDASGVLENWNPLVNNSVSGITLYKQTIYLSGRFTQINGKAQDGIAAVGLDANLQPFESKHSNIFPRITILNDKIYYGSYYPMENDMIGTQILRTDLNGKDDGWSLKLSPNSYINSLTNDGASLYIGGSFSDSNGKYTGTFLKVSP